MRLVIAKSALFIVTCCIAQPGSRLVLTSLLFGGKQLRTMGELGPTGQPNSKPFTQITGSINTEVR